MLRLIKYFSRKTVWLFFFPALRALASLRTGKTYITCDRTDGGGAQIHGRISTIVFARAFGFHYINTPMTVVDYSDQAAVDSWNRVIDFEAISSEHPKFPELISRIKVSTPIRLIWQLVLEQLKRKVDGRIRIFEVSHCHSFSDRFPRLIEKLREELQANSGLALKSGVGHKCTDAVLHVRGAIGGVDDDSPRRTSFASIEKKIAHARSLGMSITIYSSEFDDRLLKFGAQKSEIDAESDVFQVLRCMVTCKNLYMAKSSLSYVGGLLAKGQVFYEPFWSPRVSGWSKFNPM